MLRVDAMHNRQLLLRAARDAVADRGPGVGVREIADRAGVGTSTLYRHFADKQALIDAVSIDRWAQVWRMAATPVAPQDAFASVAAVLERFTRMVTADDGFILSAGLRVGRTPYAILPVRERFDARFAALWAVAQERGEIRRGIDGRDAMEMAGMIRDPARRHCQLQLLLHGIAVPGGA